MGPPLQCFNSRLYATLHDCDRQPYQCIAPTAKFTRCRFEITSGSLREANTLRRRAEQLPEGQERHDILCKFVLLHCCDKWHSWKLEADRSGCLDEVVYNYGAEIKVAIPQPFSISVPSDLDTAANSGRMIVKEEDSEMPVVTASTVSHKMELRPRLGSDGLPKRHTMQNISLFVPYKSDPSDSVRGDLLSPVPSHWTRSGQIYAFTWPSHPGFVKIGYTGYSSIDRVEAWRSCHSGATLQNFFTSVDFPERIERLIHLQMYKHRYRISICATCQKSHQEWFKLDLDEVVRIMSDWVRLSKEAPLYDHSRRLTKQWSQRIQQHAGELTAGTLLDLLDAEANQSRLTSITLKTEPATVSIPIQQEEFAAARSYLSDLRKTGSIDLESVKDDDKILPVVHKISEPIPNIVSTKETKPESSSMGKASIADFASEKGFTFTTSSFATNLDSTSEIKQSSPAELSSLTRAIDQFSKYLSSAAETRDEKEVMLQKEEPSSADFALTKVSSFSFNSPGPTFTTKDFSADRTRSSDKSDIVSDAIAHFSTFAQADKDLAATEAKSCIGSNVAKHDMATKPTVDPSVTTDTALSLLSSASAIAAQVAVQTVTATTQVGHLPPAAKAPDVAQDQSGGSEANGESTILFDDEDETLWQTESELAETDAASNSGIAIEDEDTIVVSEPIAKDSNEPVLTATKELISTFSAAQALKEDDMYSFLADFMKLQTDTLDDELSTNKMTDFVLPDVPTHEPLTLPEIPVAILAS